MPLSVTDLSGWGPLGHHWDALVDRTDGIDPWCSRLPWQRSVDTAFGHRFTADETDDETDDGPDSDPAGGPGDRAPDRGPDHVQVEERWAFAFRQRHFADGTPVLVPLDSVWAFASPFVVDGSAERRPFASEVADMTRSLAGHRDWRVAFLTGTDPQSGLHAGLVESFSGLARVVGGESTVRCVASLVDGIDAFLGRRPRVFRRNLRAATRLATGSGIGFSIADHHPPAMILQRLHHVEQRSWKGLEGSGITSPDMARLYGLLVEELHSTSSLRVSFATRDGKDLGFILGGVLGSSYRGLQISFVEEARPYSIGNLLQLHEITRLCEESVPRYDLGMDMPYKRLWSDSLMTTTPLIVIRR